MQREAEASQLQALKALQAYEVSKLEALRAEQAELTAAVQAQTQTESEAVPIQSTITAAIDASSETEEEYVASDAVLLPDQSDELSVLLEQTQAAMQSARLTTPAGSSAFDYYLAALAILPDNEVALAGEATIVIRYLSLSADAVTRKAFDKTRAYLVWA